MSGSRRLRSWCLGAPIACLLAMSASGCDTVALIGFSEREFQAIETPGFTATAGSCGGIEDGRATLRFVLLADDNSPIRPGEDLGSGTVDLTAESIEFSQTAIFETPDLQCMSNDDCRIDGMTCGTGPGLADSATNDRCQRTASVGLEGPIQFESDVTNPQLFGVVFENSGSLEGWLPSDVGALYPDWDQDGTAEGSDDPGVIPNRASDLNNRRSAALTVMSANFRNAQENALVEQRTTSFGLWEFSGTSTADVISLVDEASATDNVWATQDNTINGSRSEFSQVGGSRGNVYMAVDHVLDTAYAPEEYSGHEKTLMVFVDGPDDLRLPQFTAQSVIEKATDLGVRIFIVHLDASQEPTTQAGTPVHRDDPLYWNERVDGAQIQSPCADDTECKNFESCRIPVGYASSPGAPVEIDPDGETYCLPERDENGRIGPIDEYARIACATDGGYIYVKEANGLRPRMDWLPYTMDGLWKTDTVVDVLQNLNVPSEETYKFQTTMSVTLGGRTTTYDFSQQGEATITDDAADTRAVLFN